MNSSEATRQEGQRLKRSIWFLLSFALIAERTAYLPAPLRFIMLVILRRAELAAQTIATGMAAEQGFVLAAAEPLQPADSIDGLLQLAHSFRLLACLLFDLAIFGGYFGDETDGHPFGSLRSCGARQLVRRRAIPRARHQSAAHAIRAGPSRRLLLQIFPQCDRFIVLFVAGTIQKCHVAIADQGPQSIDAAGVCIELGKISPSKFGPFCRVVSKPFAQFSAWREVLCPFVVVKLCLGNTARPQPIDQNAQADRWRLRSVDPCEIDRHRRPPCSIRRYRIAGHA